MITLHLLLHRPGEDGISYDPTYGPYISTMPRDFDSHPLTWAMRSKLGQATAVEKSLLASLPPAVLSMLRQQMEGFEGDWKAVREYVVGDAILGYLMITFVRRAPSQMSFCNLQGVTWLLMASARVVRHCCWTIYGVG